MESKHKKGWFAPYLRRFAWRFAAAGLLGALAIACAGALLFTSGYLISRSSLRPENVLMVYVPIVLVRAFGFGKAIIQYTERLIGHDTVLRVLSAMRVKLYAIIEPHAFFMRSRFRTGELLGLLAEDIEQLQNVFVRVVLPAIAAAIATGAGLILLGAFDGPFALVMLVYCAVFLIVCPAVSLAAIRGKARQAQEQRKQSYALLTDAVFGIGDWVLSGRTSHFLSAFRGQRTQAAASENRLRRIDWRRQWLYQSCTIAAVIALALWAGGQAAEDQLGITWIAAFTLVAFPLTEAIIRASLAIATLPEYRLSIERLNQLEEEAGTPGGPLQEAVPTPFRQQEAGDEGLRLEGVCFQYGSSSRAELDNIDLHVPAGQVAAILGRSGAGKTTLLGIAQGALMPRSGRATWMGAPVGEAADRSRVFAVLNQKPYLFDTTVGNNIRLGRDDATEADVRLAARQAGIDELIESLPLGYHTRMNEAGARFSGGERQRIALARILVQNTPIVLLDEPTAQLDPATERRLLETIFTALQGKTVLWVTHHLNRIQHADRIYFLDGGKIIMHGTHEQLLQEQPYYRQLYELDRPYV